MGELIALVGRSRKAAGFAVYIGAAPAILERVDLKPEKPSILLDACGEPLSVFWTKAAARAAIRRARHLGPEFGYTTSAAYRVVALHYADSGG